jgi:small-conductance mechanosensitive channel
MQANSYPLSESLFFKGSVRIGTLALLWTFLPSLVAGFTLYTLTQIYHEKFEEDFTIPLVLVLALCMLIMQPVRNIAEQLTYRKKVIAMEVFGRWLALLFVLLTIGFMTKSTPHLARRVYVTWTLLTPTLIVAASIAMQKWIRSLTRDIAHHRRVSKAIRSYACRSLDFSMIAVPNAWAIPKYHCSADCAIWLGMRHVTRSISFSSRCP